MDWGGSRDDKVTYIIFFVEGEPRPKQSFRVSGKGGYQPARVKAWQTDVAVKAEQAMREKERFCDPFTERLSVRLVFHLGNNRRVDLDNLSKCVLDGLNGIVFKDDMQVCELILKKFVINPAHNKTGVNVFVSSLGKDNQ